MAAPAPNQRVPALHAESREHGFFQMIDTVSVTFSGALEGCCDNR
jgi:hypothetical protein